MMNPVPEQVAFQRKILAIKPGSPEAFAQCEEALIDPLLLGMLENSKTARHGRGYQVILYIKQGLAFAIHASDNERLWTFKYLISAVMLADKASFNGVSVQEWMDRATIAAGMVAYMRNNTASALSFLNAVPNESKWCGFMLSLQGRILAESGKIDDGRIRMIRAITFGIKSKWAAKANDAILQHLQAKGLPLPTELLLSIGILSEL